MLHKLRELQLWPGSLWAALSESPSKICNGAARTVIIHSLPICGHAQSAPKAIDASLPPSELIADAVKRSSRAHMFHFYSLLCEIASVPRKSPNAWIAADRLATPAAGKEKERVAGAHINHGGKPKQASTTAGTITTGSGAVSNLGHVVSFDARALARECLKEVGRELGVPQ